MIRSDSSPQSQTPGCALHQKLNLKPKAEKVAVNLLLSVLF